MTTADQIRSNARLATAWFKSISPLQALFGLDRDSLKWVDGFVEQQRTTPSRVPGTFVELIGSYLGECVIHAYGGEWRLQDGQWGVFFDDSNAVFPFDKVRKQLQNGLAAGDSILGLFDMIGSVIFNRQ
jgi:hypothetical protein